MYSLQGQAPAPWSQGSRGSCLPQQAARCCLAAAASSRTAQRPSAAPCRGTGHTRGRCSGCRPGSAPACRRPPPPRKYRSACGRRRRPIAGRWWRRPGRCRSPRRSRRQVLLGPLLAGRRELRHGPARRRFRHLASPGAEKYLRVQAPRRSSSFASTPGHGPGCRSRCRRPSQGRRRCPRRSSSPACRPRPAGLDLREARRPRSGDARGAAGASRKDRGCAAFQCPASAASAASTSSSPSVCGQFFASTSSAAYSACLSTARRIPMLNLAAASNSEFDHAGPRPSRLVVHGVARSS